MPVQPGVAARAAGPPCPQVEKALSARAVNSPGRRLSLHEARLHPQPSPDGAQMYVYEAWTVGFKGSECL